MKIQRKPDSEHVEILLSDEEKRHVEIEKYEGRVEGVNINNNDVKAIIDSIVNDEDLPKEKNIIMDSLEGVHYEDPDENNSTPPKPSPSAAFAEGNDTLIYPNNITDTKVIDYYCPDCNSTYNERVRVNVSTTTDKIHSQTVTWRTCDKCGGDTVEIDHEMIDIIVKLNKMGIKTEYCCEGHNYYDAAYILFNFRANHLLEDIPSPYMWEFEDHDIMDTVAEHGVIKAYVFVDSVDDLSDRNRWFAYGKIPLAYLNMKVFVNGNEEAIYSCDDPEKLVWSKCCSGSAMIRSRTGLIKAKCIRPILSSNPEELKKIYGTHFNICKNLYMNSLRVWVDNVETILLDKYSAEV